MATEEVTEAGAADDGQPTKNASNDSGGSLSPSGDVFAEPEKAEPAQIIPTSLIKENTVFVLAPGARIQNDSGIPITISFDAKVPDIDTTVAQIVPETVEQNGQKVMTGRNSFLNASGNVIPFDKITKH